ncbi:MAG: hypothetical protein JSS60_09710 [Verrucomicrobia bacterium]|nr:hypothetical protein [Verrucomicrobiota bacterium]
MKDNIKSKLLNRIAKAIFIGASGLAGFIIGGPVAACIGIIAGTIGSHLLQKGLQKCPQ